MHQRREKIHNPKMKSCNVESECSFKSVRHGLCSWLWMLCVHPTRYLLLALFRSNWSTLSGLREQEHDIRQAAAGAIASCCRCRKKAKEAGKSQGCATEHSTARSVSPAFSLLPCGSLIVAVAPAVAVPANMSHQPTLQRKLESPSSKAGVGGQQSIQF